VQQQAAREERLELRRRQQRERQQRRRRLRLLLGDQIPEVPVEEEVPLLDALTGVLFPLQTLGGGVVLVKSPPGVVVKPDDVLEVPGEGLHVLGHTQV
jgi:hypothetical protein